MCSIRFADGLHGPLVSEEQAIRALEKIPEHRRALCRVTYWTEVSDEDRDTMRPDPFAQASIDKAARAHMKTLDEGSK